MTLDLALETAVAIYHLSVKPISRSKGQSAVACAAYRAGDRLYDERCGVMQDYRRKGGVADTLILAPEGADWARDRERLWNAAERSEKPKNATVGREYEVALPVEFSADTRLALARGFAQALVDRYRVAADIAIHAPGAEGDTRNWHAHIQTTTRTVGPEGLGEKTRVLDARTTGPREVEAIRELWAGHVNRALEQEQIAERVDHRSYKRQGLDKTPTTHLGPTIVGLERAALREQGLAPEPGHGILEAMSQPGFEPVTDRGRGNVMASLRNRLHEWTRGAEKTLSQALERVRERTDPVVERVASLFTTSAKAAPLAAEIGQTDSASPTERAERFIETWKGLQSQHEKLFRFGDRRPRQAVEQQMRSLAGALSNDPQVQRELLGRRRELGLSPRPQRGLSEDLARSIGVDRGLYR